MQPILEEASSKIHNLRFAKVDVTVHKLLSKQYAVRGTPSFYWMHDGNLRKYDGDRSLIGFQNFARQLMRPVSMYMYVFVYIYIYIYGFATIYVRIVDMY